MSFYINHRTDSTLQAAIAGKSLSSICACSMTGCDCDASWQKFKKDPTYDHFMRAHRIKVGKMEAVSPPGFGGTVRHMQKDHPGISNPHALAWYMFEKGDKSHKKAPKGTGAKTVSKEVQKKRDKALKSKSKMKATKANREALRNKLEQQHEHGVRAGGPGSGPHSEGGPKKPVRPTKEQWSKMSPEEIRDYKKAVIAWNKHTGEHGRFNNVGSGPLYDRFNNPPRF